VPLDESWHDCNKLLIELVRNLTDINFLNSSNKEIWRMNQRNVVARIFRKLHLFFDIPRNWISDFLNVIQLPDLWYYRQRIDVFVRSAYFFHDKFGSCFASAVCYLQI
jgi:hypothetical protein